MGNWDQAVTLRAGGQKTGQDGQGEASNRAWCWLLWPHHRCRTHSGGSRLESLLQILGSALPLPLLALSRADGRALRSATPPSTTTTCSTGSWSPSPGSSP